MVTVYLQGGLGNQMFQVASTYSHAKNNNDQPVFNFSDSHTPHQGNDVSTYKYSFFKNFIHDSSVYDLCENTFTQPGHSFCEIQWKPNQQLQGFFQSEKFFINHKDEIIEKFVDGVISDTTNWLWVKEHINHISKQVNKPIVSIHVRRGDYLNFKGIHDPCHVNYYLESIDKMKDLIGDFHPYIISDDIEWCENIFTEMDCTFSPGESEVIDFMIMMNCDHNIIANSSFSWWGAYLNLNRDKVVIGPSKWFGPRGPQDQQDIIPEKWIKI